MKFFLILLFVFGCSKSNGLTEQTNYIEQAETPQSWSDFIDYRQGNIPLLIISVHGGSLEPDWIKTRTCDDAKIITDSYTREIALKIESQLKKNGYNPYIVLNDLHRKKLDLNRSLNNSNCNDLTTRPYWNLFHKQLDHYRTEIQNQFGRGLVIDIHGQSHEEQRIELGYLLSSSELRMNNLSINSSDLKNESSIKSLLNNNSYHLELTDLLTGESSMGNLLSLKGYASVPSKDEIAPQEGELYFSGGYNTAKYGSRDNGSVDAIQVELNMNGVRNTSENRSVFSKNFAEVLISYLRMYYKSDL